MANPSYPHLSLMTPRQQLANSHTLLGPELLIARAGRPLRPVVSRPAREVLFLKCVGGLGPTTAACVFGECRPLWILR